MDDRQPGRRDALAREGQDPETPAHDAAHDVLQARASQIASELLFEDLLAAAPAASARPSPARPLLVAALVLALAALAYGPTLAWMWGRWVDPHGSYEHGPLVPLVALFLVWRERRRLALAPDAAGRRLGLAVLGGATLLHAASVLLENVHFLSGAALLASLAGTALLVGGTPFARTLRFPIGFLAFAVPLPLLAVARLALELKLLAARLALGALAAVGIPAIREGSIVHLASGDVTVEDVCSGLRSLVALLALGVLVAGLEPARGRHPKLRALALVALSIPIALVANAARIAFLCALVNGSGTWVLDSWIHEGSGLVVFAVALALLLGARSLLLGREPSARAGGPLLSPASRGPGAAVGGPLAGRLALAALVLAPATLATALLDRKASGHGTPVGAGLPLELGPWRGVELPIEPYVREVLETNDLISRRYRNQAGDVVELYVAASRGDRKVAHPPDVCLAGNGYTPEVSREVELARGVRAGEPVRAVELVLVRGPEEQVVVYFYAAGPRLGPSYVGLQLASAWERLFRPDVPSALVRLSVRGNASQGSREAALASIQDLARDLVPALRRRLREETP